MTRVDEECESHVWILNNCLYLMKPMNKISINDIGLQTWLDIQ